jgi:hypothetical protein
MLDTQIDTRYPVLFGLSSTGFRQSIWHLQDHDAQGQHKLELRNQSQRADRDQRVAQSYAEFRHAMFQ